ncbi:MAG TPA: tetratricopeptide repeat protein, partial [Casimicrobiaceae bacterium]|nr:tetratricopeptide repeat protein [Casimicrobiaceae bacterium]
DGGNVDAAQVVAVCLLRRAAFAEALPLLEALVQAQPASAGARSNLASALQGAGRPAEALSSLDAAIALDSAVAVLHGNRGNVLKALGRLDEALASYDRAIALAPDHANFRYNRGTTLHEMRRPAEALVDFDRAVALDPRHASSWLNRGIVRFELRDFPGALADYEQALTLDPAHARAHSLRGVVLRERGRLDEALAGHDRALALNPRLALAHVERARVLRDLGRHDDALAGFAAAVDLDPGFPNALGEWVWEKLRCCDWDGLDAALARVAAAVDRGERACPPFPLLAMPSSLAEQQTCARTFVADRYPAAGNAPGLGGPAHERIRVGYFSADFHDHATAHLIAEVLERHDRDRFEITAFSFGPDADDPWRRRIAAAVDRFRDVRNGTDAAIAAEARALGIDIAVDLKGHTQHGRTGIFAARAAPVQASWLGYPGTLGAPYVDYLIADATLIPPEHRRHYDEKIAYLPHSYQPNDSTKRIAPDAPSRDEAGLPARGFVFCCFNHAFKILPHVYDAWMRLLTAVDGSVLWLLDSNAAAMRNLRREAAARGVAPERLAFAPRVPLDAHLARHRHADLVLDTMPYNAHTTASDALWAGVPVVTCLGDTFASRVAASLVRAVGLSELVAADLAAYEALALSLARDPLRLAALRAKLAANRTTAPLFDTPRFARDLEALYVAMIARLRAGSPPDHLLAEAA